MRRIRPTYTRSQANSIRNTSDPPASVPIRVETYSQLVREVAKIANLNHTQTLYFRGQDHDHQNKAGKTSLYPEIYRGDPLSRAEASARFEVLESASAQLVDTLPLAIDHNREDLRRRKFVRWAILQHYNVCATPFLDVTQSIHVACSFATHNNNGNYGYVYVLGFPYLNSRIGLDAEEELVNVRLLSISPPEALRPHFQEGYVAATLDVTDDYNDKTELDFNRRLIIKFEIPMKDTFWGEGFGPIPAEQLFPDNEDQVLKAILDLKEISDRMARPGDIGRFVQLWSLLESTVKQRSRSPKKHQVNIGQAIQALIEQQQIDKTTASKIENLRTFRNHVIHRTTEVPPGELPPRIEELEAILNQLDIQFWPSA